METETILIKRSDGGVSVMRFVVSSPHDRFRTEPTDEAIAVTIERGQLDCVSWRRINPEDLPGREFRNAWIDTGAAIGHDMPKAREIHRARIRAAREQRLAELDVEALKAAEEGDTEWHRQIIAEKRLLRDAPADPRIDAAQTVEQLLELR